MADPIASSLPTDVERFQEAFRDWTAEELYMLGLDILGCLHYGRGMQGKTLSVELVQSTSEEWKI